MSDNQNQQSQQTVSDALKASAPISAAPAAPTDTQSLAALVQLLLADRQEQLLERQAKAAALAEREKQRKINAEFQEKRKRDSQAICTHKKGGKNWKGALDYAVNHHTFVNGESYIRCLICGAKWKEQDTAEYLVRRGQKVPNHTKIGWIEAMRMLSDTTNTPTSSETVREVKVQRVLPSETPDFRTVSATEI